VDAIAALLDDEALRAAAARRAALLRDELRWPRVVEPLLDLLETLDGAAPARRRWPAHALAHYALRGALAAAAAVRGLRLR
jgi:hypothetical protein